MNLKEFTSTRAVVYTATIAAVYLVLNMFVAPLAYGPLQFRVSNFLYPLALFNPIYGLGFALGAFLTNLGSPFGVFDFIPMPLVTFLAAILAWVFRSRPLVALGLQALAISIGVSFFPLWLGGKIPFFVTFPGVLVSNALIVVVGWLALWKSFYGKGIFEGKR